MHCHKSGSKEGDAVIDFSFLKTAFISMLQNHDLPRFGFMKAWNLPNKSLFKFLLKRKRSFSFEVSQRH